MLNHDSNKRSRRKSWSRMLGGAIAGILLLALAPRLNARGDEEDQSQPKSRLAIIRAAPSFSLIDQSQDAKRMSEYKGQVALVSFIFTTCSGTCPATTHRMALVARELESRDLLPDRGVKLISITLDPARDSPEVLRRYMHLYDADARYWSFLTGPSSAVEKTIEAWGMWARPAPNGQLDHPSRIFLVDPLGRIREIYNLDFMKPQWVADDVELLLQEHRKLRR